MKLLEYMARDVFDAHDIPSTSGVIAGSVEELKNLAPDLLYPMVIKAQVQTGGRGKAGGVKFADTANEFIQKGKEILGMTIKGLTVEKVFCYPKVDIDREMYLSFTLDRKTKLPVMIFSPEGGVEINEIAEKNPEKLVKQIIPAGGKLDDFFIRYAIDKTGLEEELAGQFTEICRKLYDAFIGHDCMLAEINPLIVDPEGKLLALDSKVDIDDNSLYRHPEMLPYKNEMTSDATVREARSFDFLFIPVKDEGNIAVISNGSGMIMSTIDLISKNGMDVTCALDLGGGATSDRIKEALRIVASRENVDTIFINIFGGITRCDEIAGGIDAAMANLGETRLMVRLEGTNKEAGLKRLKSLKGNIRIVEGLDEGVAALAEEVKA
ncbi:MAG: ADP-forming succinate--CoA ligase subunit beta [Spirochaetaceae bacterium]|nr:ADP-forming succinate--CoA ligase subunit beta [Spirochaetaceae bacterium]